MENKFFLIDVIRRGIKHFWMGEEPWKFYLILVDRFLPEQRKML